MSFKVIDVDTSGSVPGRDTKTDGQTDGQNYQR